jgi:FkbM family methyltransferase
MSFKKIIKNILPDKIVHYLIYVRDLPKKIQINYSKIIIKFLITNIYDRNKKKIFTMRNFGGSTISRGFHLFKTDKEVAEWIEGFDANSVLVDIGANVGLFSLFAATKKHKVLALEPESLNFACLNLNIKDNDFDENITAFPISVNDEQKISYLNMSKEPKFGGSGSTFDRCTREVGDEFQPIYKQGSISLKLDDIIKSLNLTVNYIKIDVDGNELKVVKGMTEILKNKTLKSICIEINPDFSEHREVIEILKKDFKNYKKFSWDKNQEVFNYIFEK